MKQEHKQNTYVLLKRKPKKGFELLYERYGNKLCSYAQRSWKLDEDDTHDILYDTLLKIMQTHQRYTFNNEQEFANFVFQVFKNALRNHYKQKKNRSKRLQLLFFNEQELEGSESMNSPSLTQLVNKNIYENSLDNFWQQNKQSNPTMEKLKSCLKKLEAWERDLLLLRSQSFTYKEIGEYLDKPASNLKVYHGRAREKLINYMNEIDTNA